MTSAARNDDLSTFLCGRLAEHAERVRWRSAEIPWAAIERDKVTPRLLRLTREMAFSEQTTFTATSQFVREFASDLDFSQWISVWFFEETRHPQTLMRWLGEFGETFASDFVREGRVATPFMKSRTGTLVSNIISEMFASAGYMTISRQSREPVLSLIARNIAADEARHASSFFAYARQSIDHSDNPDAERLAAAQVLYFWMNDNNRVSHPVNQAAARCAVRADLAETADDGVTDTSAVRVRVIGMIENLIGCKIEGSEHLRGIMRTLTTEARKGRPVAAAV
jgi:hypothetical protein